MKIGQIWEWSMMTKYFSMTRMCHARQLSRNVQFSLLGLPFILNIDQNESKTLNFKSNQSITYSELCINIQSNIQQLHTSVRCPRATSFPQSVSVRRTLSHERERLTEPSAGRWTNSVQRTNSRRRNHTIQWEESLRAESIAIETKTLK